MKIGHLLVSAILLLTAGNVWAGIDKRPYPKPAAAPKPIIPVIPKPIIPVTPPPVVVVIPKPVIPTPPPVVVVTPKPVIPTPPPVVVVTPKPVCHIKPSKGGGHHKAPEINAASGTSAIALLTGVLLLAGERLRSRRA